MAVFASNPWLLPALISGAGAIGQGMSAGAKGELAGYGGKDAPRRSDLTGTMLGDATSGLEQVLGVAAGRAQTPLSAGTASMVQPVAGLTGFDPALTDPSQVTRPGINFGDRGPFAQAYRGNGLGTVEQPAPDFPNPGGDIPQLMEFLKLLGVEQDQSGNFFAGATGGGNDWSNNDDSPYLSGQDPNAYSLERKFPARTPGSAEDYDLPMNPDVRHPDYEGEPGGEGSETEGPGGPGSIFAFTGARPLPRSGVRRKLQPGLLPQPPSYEDWARGRR